MADNFTLSDNAGAKKAATDEVTYSGDTADVQLMRPVLTTGSEGSKTVVGLTGDATYGLDVDVARVPVDVVDLEADAGYAVGDLAKNPTQTEEGRLRTVVAALVADTIQAYADGQVRSLSLNQEGRLRVSTAAESYNLASWGSPEAWSDFSGWTEGSTLSAW